MKTLNHVLQNGSACFPHNQNIIAGTRYLYIAEWSLGMVAIRNTNRNIGAAACKRSLCCLPRRDTCL